MEILEKKSQYPFSIRASYFYKYIKDKKPCIIFFENSSDDTCNSIMNKMIYLSKRFPKVICFKVLWERHLKYYQNINPSNVYDITLWKEGEKIMVCSDPPIEQLYEMYTNAHKLIYGEDPEILKIFLSTELSQTPQKSKEAKKLFPKKRILISPSESEIIKNAERKISIPKRKYHKRRYTNLFYLRDYLNDINNKISRRSSIQQNKNFRRCEPIQISTINPNDCFAMKLKMRGLDRLSFSESMIIHKKAIDYKINGIPKPEVINEKNSENFSVFLKNETNNNKQDIFYMKTSPNIPYINLSIHSRNFRKPQK